MVKNKYLISQSSQFYNYSNLHPKGVLIAEAVARFLYSLRLAVRDGVLIPRYMKKTWVGKQFMIKDL
jgi:hypothetical protein